NNEFNLAIIYFAVISQVSREISYDLSPCRGIASRQGIQAVVIREYDHVDVTQLKNSLAIRAFGRIFRRTALNQPGYVLDYSKIFHPAAVVLQLRRGQRI